MRIRRIAALTALTVALGAASVAVLFRTDQPLPKTAAAVAQPDGPATDPTAEPTADPIRADEIVNVIPQDAKTALVSPTFLAAAAAFDIHSDEEVIGVVINGDARAFPLATLNVHEIVDDVIGGQPVAVTW